MRREGQRRRLGVIGGMGPLASAHFMYRLTMLTPAEVDQDHVEAVLWSDPRIPVRTLPGTPGHESPLPRLWDGIHHLEGCGCDGFVLVCNAVHAWYDIIADRVAPRPVFHIADAALADLRRQARPGEVVGVAGSRTTIDARIYQDRLTASGFGSVMPTDETYKTLLLPTIMAVKSGHLRKGYDLFQKVVCDLVDGGADRVLLGCTELPVALAAGPPLPRPHPRSRRRLGQRGGPLGAGRPIACRGGMTADPHRRGGGAFDRHAAIEARSPPTKRARTAAVWTRAPTRTGPQDLRGLGRRNRCGAVIFGGGTRWRASKVRIPVRLGSRPFLRGIIVNGRRILAGGLGHDSHSVGLIIIVRALDAAGYLVRSIGIQRSIDEFIRASQDADVVLVSNMDGHATTYLPLEASLPKGEGRPLWFIGGHFCLDDDWGPAESRLREFGFDRVFPRSVDLESLLATLRDDLASVPRLLRPSASDGRAAHPRDCLLGERYAVIASWPTGAAAADLARNADHLRRSPNLSDVGRRAQAAGLALIQPRSGVPHPTRQLSNFLALQGARADVLSFQIDSYTRLNDHWGCEDVLRSLQSDQASRGLNGYPMVNHGVFVTREIVERCAVPMQTRHSARDPRLLAEISYASGITGFEGGPICYNTPYYRDYSIEDSVRAWSYVDALTGLYFRDYGVVLDREFFGCLTATLVPPCIAICVVIIEALLAAEQGVKSVSLGYAEQGARFQDIAAVRVLGCLARRVLDEHGHSDVFVSTVFYQFMAGFPPSLEAAEALISASATTAALSGATRVIVKTAAEPRTIPTVGDNADALLAVRSAMASAHTSLLIDDQVAAEASVIERSARALLSSVLAARGPNLGARVSDAFKLGLLDVPFSPAEHNRGEVLTVRDGHGAVRFLNTGRLALPDDVKVFHADQISMRRKVDRQLSNLTDMQIVENDVLAIPRGAINRWPLDAEQPSVESYRVP